MLKLIQNLPMLFYVFNGNKFPVDVPPVLLKSYFTTCRHSNIDTVFLESTGYVLLALVRRHKTLTGLIVY